MNTTLYTLTLMIKTPKSKFKTFFCNKTQDNKYYIFVRNINDFLLKMQKVTADLIIEAEEKDNENFTISNIVNP